VLWKPHLIIVPPAHLQAIRPELEKLSAKLKENVSSSFPTLL
jgi:hypothetical protein